MSEIPWLLLLYSLPAGNSSARVGIWRKVRKTGALPFKSSSYLLPNRPDLLERFQWLAQQIQETGGEATVALVSELEGISQEKMARQFNDARAADYGELIASLNDLISRGRKMRDDAQLAELDKLRRRFAEIRNLDYFGCPLADKAAMLLEKAMEPPAGKPRKGGKNTMPALSPQRFTGKVWLTRPQPAIDRVGSAWLIHHHIDPKARFVFGSRPEDYPDAIPYDMTGVEFTHHGDDCTFENLLRRFGIKDKILRRIGEMVHDADLEDDRFQTIEAFGMDRVFKGWARLGVADEEIFRRGFHCFDALFAFLKSKS